MAEDILPRISAEGGAETVIQQRAIVEDTRELLGIYSRINEDAKAYLSLAKQIGSAAELNNTVLRRSGKLEQQILRDTKLVAAAERELAVLQARGIANRSKMNSIQAELTTRSGEDLVNYINGLDAQEKEIALLLRNKKILGDILTNRKEELKFQHEVNGNLGIAGAIVDNLNKLGVRFLGGLGLNLGIFKEGLADAKDESLALSEAYTLVNTKFKDGKKITKEQVEAIRDGIRPIIEQAKINEKYGNLSVKYAEIEEKLADKTKRAKGETVKKLEAQRLEIEKIAISEANSLKIQEKQSKILGVIGSGLRQTLLKAFLDPTAQAVVGFSILKNAFLEVNKASVDYQRLTGQNITFQASLNLKVATTVDYLKTALEITNQLGLTATNVFSSQTLTSAAEFKNLLGLSGDEAGKLALFSEINNRTMNSNLHSIVNTVNGFNRANRAAVNHGTILRDVAKTSDGIAASMGSSASRIAEAASAARRLGLELNQLDAIANSLLDFESSIEAELEAQLLTGKNINLTKARELALSNDLAGVGKEIFSNSASLYEFGRLNRIQQDSYAKALGMTRDQLARAAYLQAIQTGMTEEQAAAATRVNAEEMKRITAQESLQKSIDKIAQSLAAPAALLSGLVENTALFYTTLSLIAGLSMGKLVVQLAAAAVNAGIFATGTATAANALTFGLATAAIVGGLLAVSSAMASTSDQITTKVQDGTFDPNGGPIIKYPKGKLTAQIDKDDSIVVGTNLKGAGTSNDETNQLLKQLISETRKKQNIYLGHAYRLNEGLELYV